MGLHDRCGPLLGSLQAEAYALRGEDGWTGRGLVWRRRAPAGRDEVLAEIVEGPHASASLAVDHAYARAHAEAIRLLLRHFACF